jgi:2-hydroxycyclohexanecarboxyl-CoA dehydrogenase
MTDRVVVITGAGRGIGAAIAHRLATDGARVAILDLDVVSARTVAEGLPGGRGHAYEVDVTSFEQIEAVADRVAQEVGTVTGVVNNAGWSPAERFLDTSLEEQERVIDVNYVGSLHLCRAFLPGLVTAKHGRIVFVGSDAARVGIPKEAVYAGAKAALLGFAKSLAVEVARDGITVNVVSPGSTDTELLREMLSEEQIERRVRGNPMRRLASPADIASAVAFFLGEDAAYVTGQILSVNGGMSRLG